MLQLESHIPGVSVADRIAPSSIQGSICGSMSQAVRSHADRHQVDVPAGAAGVGGVVSGLAPVASDAPVVALTQAPVCREYATEPTVDSRVISAWGLNGRMWNLNHKFGTFDHFQRWRCAT